MRAWNHVLVALAVSFAATGCKFTTCADDDEDCASNNGGSLFDGGDTSGGSSNGGSNAGGSDDGGTNAGGSGGTPAAEGGEGGDTATPSSGAGGEADGGEGTATGGTSTGGASTGGTGPTDVVDMCSPDDPDLSECNACIQRTCCTEILACSNDLACGGDYSISDAGVATTMSEIRCVSDENAFLADDANAAEDDEVIGYAGDESVELASMRCAERAGGDLSETTTELVQCMLHGMATEGDDEFGDCAAACFGVEF